MSVHQQPAYAGCFKLYGPLHETEAAAREILSLPLFPEMTENQRETVVHQLRAWGTRSYSD